MSEHICAVEDCGNPVQDATICARCTDALERDLGDVPAFHAELEVTLTRQTAMGERSASKAAETPVYFHEGASEALVVMRSTLVGWVRTAVEEDGAEWPADTPEAMATLLMHRLNWLRRHEAADEAVDELKSMMGLVRRTVDRPQARWYAGPCGYEVENRECPGELYAHVGAIQVTCPECSEVYDVAARRDWLKESTAAYLGTAAEISALCRHMLGDLVTAAMIRGYAHRGSIAAHGEARDPRGRVAPLYKLGDVFTAAARAGGDPREKREARRASREVVSPQGVGA